MPFTNHERVGKGFAHLAKGLTPFVERELQAVYGEEWRHKTTKAIREDKAERRTTDAHSAWDAQSILLAMSNAWSDVFHRVLGRAESGLISELREIRDRWAHQKPFTTDDAYRALDSMSRLLAAVSAPEAAEVESQKQELLRVRFEEHARKDSRRAADMPVAGQPFAGLKPWREVVTPHPDVASGNYQQAEFAADLGQVFRGEGSNEYRDPSEFFRRTYITEGLKRLLSGAVLRVHGSGGDPVVELQTNFGGGKTHALLALYHLFSGAQAPELPGVEEILQFTETGRIPAANRVVLNGRDIPPGQARKKPDGTLIRTLWGELGWQLGGKEGYEFVADADKTGTSPGDGLVELFKRYAPCVILIDEWVVYARQLYHVEGLPGGSFEAHFSFAQALTEAAKAVPKTLLVLAIPASDIEIGGEGGQAALDRLKKVVGRVQAPWRPASAEESFEIVRRRLFLPLTDHGKFRERDIVIKAFMDLYRGQAQEFPNASKDPEFERRLKSAYPIHPELFDRLYEDWSTLEKFQRTRGVLRLMAAVIHSLWERQDSSLLILPSTVPIYDPRVQPELTNYLEDRWVPVIEADVDGPNSLPLRLDRENPNLGRYSACRRVARTIFLGSAPTLRSAHRGIDDRSIKLGCVQPGEAPAVFGDALRRLADNATHLYPDGDRYWFSVQPTVNRLAQQLAEQFKEDDVNSEVEDRLRKFGTRDEFAAVHPPPNDPSDVKDEPEARLVILGPNYSHVAKDAKSPAREQAALIMQNKGAGPRKYRNALVFLAADKARLGDLRQAACQYMAWKKIEEEREERNLDPFQSRLTTSKREESNNAVQARIPESFCWLLVPEQEKPGNDVAWAEIRLQGSEALAVRAARKLKNEERLVADLAGTRLRLELDRIPLWRDDHVRLKQLVEDFFQYVYLPRLVDPQVLVVAIRNGLNLLTWKEDSFAYAEGYDGVTKKYKGLQAGRPVRVTIDNDSLLVKADVAARILEGVSTALAAGMPSQGEGNGEPSLVGLANVAQVPAAAGATILARFHGTVDLDPARVGRDAGKVAEEILQHLAGMVDSTVEVSLEIHAERPSGFPDDVVRTVTENAKTLKFKTQGFEER
ncbi:MAG TPA: Swt1 family HEPN domain-containing protein [Thermoplasmata archaeon]|nr:Swt1 family HEPN domain-containing protein [Thermoplasmata archaeon]